MRVEQTAAGTLDNPRLRSYRTGLTEELLRLRNTVARNARVMMTLDHHEPAWMQLADNNASLAVRAAWVERELAREQSR